VELARILRAGGTPCVALLRASSDAAALEAAGARVLRADVLQAAEVSRAFQEAGALGAVVSLVGGRPFRKDVPPDFTGNRHLIDATRAAGVRRFVMVSSIGAGASYAAAPLVAKLVLGKFMKLKTQAEEYLRASGLDWTIVRPGHLRNGAGNGKGVLVEDDSASGAVQRADVARLVAASLGDPQQVGHVYACLER
jgi:uncharacterized protein YbjT (DUF2867 family)